MTNWYPGVMAKTEKQLSQEISLIDLVIEIRDARLPLTTRAPFLVELVQAPKRILVLSKADLADPLKTKKWLEHFRTEGRQVFALNFLERSSFLVLRKHLLSKAQEANEVRLEAGRGKRDMRVLVGGIPNVGKSTLLNSLGGRRASKASDKAGITRGMQWIQTGQGLLFLDSPGILTPKLEWEIGLLLTSLGSIKEGIFEPIEVACYLLERLGKLYPQLVKERFNVSLADMLPFEALEFIARQRGYLEKGGKVNQTNIAIAILKDFRTGAIGRITLEEPGV